MRVVDQGGPTSGVVRCLQQVVPHVTTFLGSARAGLVAG
jgi:hypothetical protein